jgi:hypothetical protein
MSDIAQIALEFTREVAGFRDARPLDGTLIGYNGSADVDALVFDYADLNQVVAAVREWARAESMSIRMETTPGDQVRVSLRWLVLDDPFHVVEHENECHALLRACFEGALKLRTQAI